MTVRFVAAAMATAGTIIAQQIGFGFVTQVDPTQGGQSLLLANFMTLLGVAIVFAMDLHHLAIGAVYDLSKRTALYGHYSYIDNTNSAFRVAGTAAGGPLLNVGDSSAGFEVGIRHSF